MLNHNNQSNSIYDTFSNGDKQISYTEHSNTYKLSIPHIHLHTVLISLYMTAFYLIPMIFKCSRGVLGMSIHSLISGFTNVAQPYYR